MFSYVTGVITVILPDFNKELVNAYIILINLIYAF